MEPSTVLRAGWEPSRRHRYGGEQHLQRQSTAIRRSALIFRIYVPVVKPGTQLANGNQVPWDWKSAWVPERRRPSVSLDRAMQQTGNPLDLAIQGDGFFQVTLPDGSTAFTRDGSLRQDVTGNVVTTDGFVLNPPITIPTTATGSLSAPMAT